MNPSWPLDGRTISLQIVPSFIFESWRSTRERDSITTSPSMKSILFMWALAEPHKQPLLHKHVGQCLLSILALHDFTFLCFLLSIAAWHKSLTSHLSQTWKQRVLLNICQCERFATEPAWPPFRRFSDTQQTERWSINLQENTSHLPCGMIFGADQSPQQAPQQISPRVIFSPTKLQIKRLLCYCFQPSLSLWPCCIWSAWTLSLWLEIDFVLTS